MIHRIRIQNFRSLLDVEVRLEPLTVLIGRSGTGKSNFVRAIRFLRDYLSLRQSVDLSTIWPMGVANQPIGFEVDFSVGRMSAHLCYSLSIHPRGQLDEKLEFGDRIIFHQSTNKWVVEPQVLPRITPGSPCLGSLTGIREATIAHISLTSGIGCYDFPGNVLAGEQGPAPGSKGYRDDGSNALPTVGAILDDLNHLGDWSALTKSLHALNGQLSSLDLRLPSRDRIEAGYIIRDTLFLLNVAQESEGFRRYLAHLLALYQTPAKQTVLFEHPESGIHPGALESLFYEFDRHVKRERGQVILTTHSPQLLDYFAPESIRVVDIENHATKIGSLAPEQLESLREKLLHPGELLTVDPARLEGQLIGEP